MSVGLIHDIKMDNMKSLEQDKVEPNLKMNDEHKVKQEMYVSIQNTLIPSLIPFNLRELPML